jgi:hypothetical protein
VGPRGWRPGQVCGRDNRENVDFPSTHISRITINLSSLGNGLSVRWANPRGAIRTGPYRLSPGAGLCCNNCDRPAVSQANGSLCTPKGHWSVTGNSQCTLGGHPNAHNPTHFQRAGIATRSQSRCV